MSELLFSYGTLQLEKVQLETFGRKLEGTKEFLVGFRVEHIKIIDKAVLEQSQQAFHPIAVVSDNQNDKIEGTLFDISEEELKRADTYEVSDYKRVKVTFESGKKGWVYIKNLGVF